jgi:hypothetical protein
LLQKKEMSKRTLAIAGLDSSEPEPKFVAPALTTKAVVADPVMDMKYVKFAEDYLEEREDEWRVMEFNFSQCKLTEHQQRLWEDLQERKRRRVYVPCSEFVELLAVWGVSLNEVLAQSGIPAEKHSAIRNLQPYRLRSILGLPLEEIRTGLSRHSPQFEFHRAFAWLTDWAKFFDNASENFWEIMRLSPPRKPITRDSVTGREGFQLLRGILLRCKIFFSPELYTDVLKALAHENYDVFSKCQTVLGLGFLVFHSSS